MQYIFKMKKWVLYFYSVVLASTLTEAINDEDNGQYHPDDEGRYVPDDSGKYVPDYSGAYHDDGTGRYSGDDSGKYAHLEDKYRHQRDKQFPYNPQNNFKSQQIIRSQKLLSDKSLQGNFPSASTAKTQYVQPKPNFINTSPVKFGTYDDNRWKIIKLANNVKDDGFHWEYETENEIKGEENAQIYNSGRENEAIRTKGFYQYTGADNRVYNVEYTADENGFIPKGDHLHPVLQKAILETLNRDLKE
ncbi:larval cuticle protein LCP-30-like [Diabrotica virgifera virgifera]|uniref:Larval cuticle protein LCP-30-like n=1 Tax=Diabrotica virgifera virgifera TaxID=50390 RepID=A0ABM5KTQ7_DIAVI|nr:larval cuticle protein LCP-30-like [Diabrotica virgifera virgifera]